MTPASGLRLIVLLWAASLVLAACNTPRASASPTTVSTPSSAPTSTSTASPIPNPTLTPTASPVPCDPSTVDFCVVDGSFLFQRPIRGKKRIPICQEFRAGTDAGML